jgi:hypothetical protein
LVPRAPSKSRALLSAGLQGGAFRPSAEVKKADEKRVSVQARQRPRSACAPEGTDYQSRRTGAGYSDGCDTAGNRPAITARQREDFLIAIFVIGISHDAKAPGTDIVTTTESRPSNDTDVVPILHIAKEMNIASYVALRDIC